MSLMKRKYRAPNHGALVQIRITELAHGFKWSMIKDTDSGPISLHGENSGDFETAARKIKDILDGFFQEVSCKPKIIRKRRPIVAQLNRKPETASSESTPSSAELSTNSEPTSNPTERMRPASLALKSRLSSMRGSQPKNLADTTERYEE